MRLDQGHAAAVVCAFGLVGCLSAGSAAGLALNGTGAANTFSGTLGPVDIVAIDDAPGISGGVSSGGVIVNFTPSIPVVRVQYDLLNRAGNPSIFEFTVPYEPGVTVVGATNPGAFMDVGGTKQTFWAGSNSTTIFDSGFGTYTADNTAFGSEWVIDFAPDSVTWRHLGSGFAADTATGRTDLGNAFPTFGISFAAGTTLDFVVAEVRGDDIFGAPVVSSSGRTLSGVVPEPATAGLLFGLLTIGLHRNRR